MVKSIFSTLGLPKGREPVIVDYTRTAIGKKRGGLLRRVRGDNWIIHCVKTLADRNFEGLNLEKMGELGLVDCQIGNNSQIGATALDIGRTTILSAGLPWTIPGTSVNRQCSSGMQTVYNAFQEIVTGDKEIVFAGGVEAQTVYPIMADLNVSMGAYVQTIPPNRKITESPYVMASEEKYGHPMAGQIEGAELMGKVWNEKIGNTREEFRLELDEISLASHKKALKPFAIKARGKEITPIKVPKLDEKGNPILDENHQMIDSETDIADVDEAPRPSTSLEKLQQLKGIVKRKTGYLTAGNSCPESDGAAAMILTSREYAEQNSLPIRGTLENCFVIGTDPILMLTGPIASVKGLMKKADTNLDAMKFIEINEAFSTVVKASTYELGLDWRDNRINQYGGAIAIGHPTGMTGTRLIGTILHQLEDSNQDYGLATLCIGLGMGFAAIVKREGA
jgi:acetyl-CoA acyltransferase